MITTIFRHDIGTILVRLKGRLKLAKGETANGFALYFFNYSSYRCFCKALFVNFVAIDTIPKKDQYQEKKKYGNRKKEKSCSPR